jgi:site-specific recombinase XerD
MEAKVSLMNRAEKGLSGEISADGVNTVLRILADVLQGFEVEELDQAQDLNEDLLECYLDALKVEGRSPKTLERYAYVIRKMMQAMKVPTRQITVYHIRSYLSAEQKRGIQEGTLDGIRQVLSAYFGWLRREGLIERDPMGNVGAIKRPKKQKEIYTPVEIEKLNEKSVDFRFSLRNRAIVEFLRATGCRISEVTGLNREKVNFQTLEVVVLGKGNKERKVYLDDVTGMILKKYLDSREDENPALFVGQDGERLSAGGIRFMLKSLAKKAGVEHCHPHKFRRTLATNLNRRGMPIQEVAHILGHEKLDTTMKYVMLNDDDLKNSYRKHTL